jgi:stress response protein YsnF
MQQDEGKIVVPVIQEEVRADAKPVQTGSVRVTKSTETHDELIEQELRKGHAEVKRISINRVVEGPQQPYRSGNTLVVPVVSEMLQGCEKQWVLTEEIRITQLEKTQVVQQEVPVSTEHVRVERLDAQGNVTSTEAEPVESPIVEEASAEESVRETPRVAIPSIVNRPTAATAPGRKVLSSPKGILGNRPRGPGRKPL